MEVEARTNLKSLRTDGGGGYIYREWKAFAKDKGFQHQLTAPYSPKQNGINERLNRTLLEGAYFCGLNFLSHTGTLLFFMLTVSVIEHPHPVFMVVFH